jgi:hypothetical protein
MQPFHYEKDTVFPTSVSSAYTYINGYNQKDTLSNGVGYWLKYSAPQMVEVPGMVIFSDTFDVKIGWNMIGSITYPIPVAGIGTDPGSMVTSEFYHYTGDNNYDTSDTIHPGAGYWVKASQAGQLILSSSATMMAKNRIRIISGTEMPPPPPGEFVLAVQEIPKEYVLEQAYPNPFNPTTTIKYQLPIDSRVSLKVYNTLGQVISVLKDEVQPAGFMSVTWDAMAYSSGIYFYRMEAVSVTDPSKTFIQVRKMLLVK